jgi:superfamily II DNA or RNA helicase
MTDVVIERVDDVHMQIHCDNSIAMEMHEYFSFFAKNYRWMPAFKENLWDGKLRLFDLSSHKIYSGLVYEVVRFCLDREYTLYIDDDIGVGVTEKANTDDFVASLGLPFTPYDYQIESLKVIIEKKRRLILSPTSSGKSLIVYLGSRYLLENKLATKILVLVPTTSLVEQMEGDFIDYAAKTDWWVDDHVHKIYDYDGVTKDTDKDIVVSTWQSIYKLNKRWFSQFDAVIVDEAHQASADSIKGIMKKMVACPYRIGLTGTIEDTETHKLVLQGLFGKVYRTTTTKELMDRGIVSSLKIKGFILKYPPDECMQMSKKNYQAELKTILEDERRNAFIHKLSTTRDGNVLVLFNRVDKHGIPLYEQIVANSNGRKVFLVHGDTPVKEREAIRAYAEKHNNVVIVASFGTFSTGINIKNLQYVVFAHPYKAKIKTLQSIGRMLRKTLTNADATLFDIADDYKWKSKENTTFKHFKERLRIYDGEEFEYKLLPLEIPK